jgi:hypothetical protein
MSRKILLLSLVAVCGLAIGCGVPASSQTASGNLEAYWVSNVDYAGKWMMLETVDSWEGQNESRDIFFKADEAPWVVNVGCSETSQIQSSFRVMVQTEEQYATSTFPFESPFYLTLFDSEDGVVWLDENPTDVIAGRTVCEVTGDCVISVFASGCEWWVKVGVEPPPTPPSEATLSAILGKWRHGLPEECPPSMGQHLYEELKELPENETYYLEFFADGSVQFICEGQVVDGTYTFISDEEVEISWSVLSGTLAEFFDSRGVYEIEFSEDNMTLQGGLEEYATYLRVD